MKALLVLLLLAASRPTHAADPEISTDTSRIERWWLKLKGPPVASDRKEFMDYDHLSRYYLVHEPALAVSTKSLAMVMVLHGGGGTPEGAEAMSEMSDLSDKEGFLAVYPAGTSLMHKFLLTWNSGNCCGYAMKNDVDDSGFLAALINKLITEGRVDPARVYVTGMSNGGMMAHRLACEHAELISAAAPVAGQLNITRCRPVRPVSILMIHGLKDERAPYEGGFGTKSLAPRDDRSVPETLRLWGIADGCDPKSRFSEEGAVSQSGFKRCRAHSTVLLYTHQGGHIWPGGRQGPHYGNLDEVLPYPKATALIWDFFKSHARSGPAP
jgi:polyhydroxybutyrate depolymerase